jgi:preprotein translocase subunit SecF
MAVAFLLNMKPFYTVMFVVSVVLLVGSIAALSVFGLNLGVDFKGGSVLEVEFENGRPPLEDIQAVFEASSNEALHGLLLTPVGEKGLIIRSSDRTHMMHSGVWITLEREYPDAGLTQLHFDFIGPAIGEELRSRSITAIVVLLVAVLGYIAWMFRTLSRSLSLWAMAAGTVLGLAHDIIIPMGVFAVLGRYAGVEISAIFVAAVLTILGYTVSDKVVIYDRVRENILRGVKVPLPDIVHASVLQTLVRSINNTLVVMLSSLAVFLFGGDSIRYFALALMLGIGLGAYSSIFVAAPVLVWLSRKHAVRRS